MIDFKGYTSALHSPRMNLVQPDTIARAVGNTVTTANGVEIRDVDLIVLSIGFKVTDYLFPLKVFNDQGENLGDRLRANGVKTYLCASNQPISRETREGAVSPIFFFVCPSLRRGPTFFLSSFPRVQLQWLPRTPTFSS